MSNHDRSNHDRRIMSENPGVYIAMKSAVKIKVEKRAEKLIAQDVETRDSMYCIAIRLRDLYERLLSEKEIMDHSPLFLNYTRQTVKLSST